MEEAMKATAKDLRFHSKELLDTVNRGEDVVITFRGKPCAKLIPYREKKEERITQTEGGDIHTHNTQSNPIWHPSIPKTPHNLTATPIHPQTPSSLPSSSQTPAKPNPPLTYRQPRTSTHHPQDRLSTSLEPP